jgi:hypothetical protein
MEVDVLKVNKMGAYAAFEDSLRVLLPRDLHLGNDLFDEIKVGEKIRVKIAKTRFSTKDQFIMAVGKLDDSSALADVPSVPSAPLNTAGTAVTIAL